MVHDSGTPSGFLEPSSKSISHGPGPKYVPFHDAANFEIDGNNNDDDFNKVEDDLDVVKRDIAAIIYDFMLNL